MRIFACLLATFILNACASTPGSQSSATERQLQAVGDLGAVATASPQATAVALGILDRGGTAADAAIAAARAALQAQPEPEPA